MDRRQFLTTTTAATLAAGGLAGTKAFAADPVKIGFILPMTGQQQSTGRETMAAVKLYMAQNGDTVAGRKIEIIVKDDAAVPDNAKRIAQELIVNEKVHMLAGFGITPCALAVAPLATQAKIPELVTAAGTSIITERSPYIVRTSFTLAQSTVPMAQWAAKNGIKKVVSMVSDYAPGVDCEVSFKEEFTEQGGQIIEAIRFPLANPDFAPFLQRARDAKPDAIFVFRAGRPGRGVRQAVPRARPRQGGHQDHRPGRRDRRRRAQRHGRRGDRHRHGAFLLGPHHNSAANKKYVSEFEKANSGMRPNFMSVGGYDGMHLIYEALKKTNGDTDGDKLVAAMKGLKWESPRGPISIDPETRDIIQNVYIRKVEKKNGQLYNVEFATYNDVKDPIKAAKK